MGSLGSLHTHDFHSGPPTGGAAAAASSGLLPPVVGDKGHGLAAGGKKAPSGLKGKAAPGEKGKGSGNQENSLNGVLDTVTRRLNEQASVTLYSYITRICPPIQLTDQLINPLLCYLTND